jgi:hypothetical protein
MAPAAALPDNRTEKEVQRDVCAALRTLGFWFVDTSQPHRALITPGLADLIVMGRGVVAFIEVKAQRGRLSSAQKSFRDHVESNGGRYVVARSVADVVAWVESLPPRRAI